MYRVVTYPEASGQIAELPGYLLLDYARALGALAAAPWDGMSHNSNNPGAEVRRWLFGPLGVGLRDYMTWADTSLASTGSGYGWLTMPSEGVPSGERHHPKLDRR